MSPSAAATAHIEPLSLESLTAEDRDLIEKAESLMGFKPNDALTMARVPGLLPALSALVNIAYGPGVLDLETRRLVAMISSQASGCRYCQAHTRHGALRQGLDQSRLEDLWQFETSERFSDAEKAAMKVAWLGSLAPSQVEEEHMTGLKSYYDQEQILEIVTMISLFGFLNRWNDIVNTTLEAVPAATLESS